MFLETYNSKEEVKSDLVDFSVKNHKTYKIKYSTKTRFQADCYTNNCDFTINLYKKDDGKFHTANFLDHNCTPSIPKTSKAFIKEKAKSISNVFNEITPKSFIDYLRDGSGAR
ncbi:hypothetical protein AYI70_g9577, partial [Smittium culicis]